MLHIVITFCAEYKNKFKIFSQCWFCMEDLHLYPVCLSRIMSVQKKFAACWSTVCQDVNAGMYDEWLLSNNRISRHHCGVKYSAGTTQWGKQDKTAKDCNMGRNLILDPGGNWNTHWKPARLGMDQQPNYLRT